ncbi:hypothetical protein CR205_16765 [Alteribacter lacisalsi]|uniref:Uncharacterized protein n=1 Tax=Alteribacter lacisalsi TaxID=2045244 RepID=A0A2W0H2K6_9BACI|nr:hypothetical protein [Alteribacter lacisalsi]PYZ96023.1 hypothetical protein CR205_16765 [Alteribacter lacisalsi]
MPSDLAWILIIIILCLIVVPFIWRTKYLNESTVQFIIPGLMVFTVIITLLINIPELLRPGKIADQAILDFILQNQAIAHTLLIVSIFLILILVWMIARLPFSDKDLRKFSLFGASAEFAAQVEQKYTKVSEVYSLQEAVRTILLDQVSINKNIPNFIIENRVEDQDGNESIEYVIDVIQLLTYVLRTIQKGYSYGQSNYELRYFVSATNEYSEEELKEQVDRQPVSIKEACHNVLLTGTDSVYKGTIAFKTNMFSTTDEFALVSIHTEDFNFQEQDLDFFKNIFSIVQVLTEYNIIRMWTKRNGLELER